MLFYTSNEDEGSPEAMIHNVDTGITYRLGVHDSDEGPMPVVELIMPALVPGQLLPRQLFRGAQAVEFWRALLYCNPWNGASVAPRVFLDRVAGSVQEPASSDNDLPF